MVELFEGLEWKAFPRRTSSPVKSGTCFAACHSSEG